MHATVCRWGNSLGIRIPRGVAQDARVTEGTAVDVRVEDGRIVLVPLDAEPLERLLDRITPENRHEVHLADGPIGREAW